MHRRDPDSPTTIQTQGLELTCHSSTTSSAPSPTGLLATLRRSRDLQRRDRGRRDRGATDRTEAEAVGGDTARARREAAAAEVAAEVASETAENSSSPVAGSSFREALLRDRFRLIRSANRLLGIEFLVTRVDFPNRRLRLRPIPPAEED